jgi:Zn-dependent M28 family amino/carboxypeptidase
MNYNLNIFLVSIVFLIMGSCNQQAGRTSDSSGKKKDSSPPVNIPAFNADSAYGYIEQQVSFGPRVPNTPQHTAAAEYLARRLGAWADTLVIQHFKARAYDGSILNGQNIIGSFNPGNRSRILLCAHWDTRPFADHDPDPKNHQVPIDGANDGGSGVGVLMEVARNLALQRPETGVDIIFFDAEDYGPPQDHQKRGTANWWALGSQYWARNPHNPDYYAKYGILLDMVGGHNARFYMEGYSMMYAPGILKKVWNTAHRAGFRQYFLFEQKGYIDDDHKPINEIMKIPAINIIHMDDASSNGSFFEHWHTVHDNMEAISKESLQVVGQTILTVIFEEK